MRCKSNLHEHETSVLSTTWVKQNRTKKYQIPSVDVDECAETEPTDDVAALAATFTPHRRI